MRSELKELQFLYISKQTSLNVLSGSLIQFAKQGISLVHRSIYLDEKKAGNEVVGSGGINIQWIKPGSTTPTNLKLSDLIVAARNQSLHYEEGLDNNNNEAVFNTLHAYDNNNFELITKADIRSNGKQPKNFARDIIKLLEWNNYEKFTADMESIK